MRFVEALSACVSHQALQLGTAEIRLTDLQIRQTIEDRNGLKPDPKQVRRLKARFVSLPDRPAGRFELLLRKVRGDRRPGQAVGSPSQYLVTGLSGLLGPVVG